MSRFTALTLTAAMLIVVFCCPPPAFAEPAPKVMVCPITQEPCETKSKCDPPAPELIAAPAAVPALVVPSVAMPIAPALAVPHESRPAELHYWSAPTRTVVLRI